MKALVKTKPVENKNWEKGFKYLDVSTPEIKSENDVLLKVYAGAICGTDVGIYNCKDSLRVEMSKSKEKQIIVGHEFSGWIIDAGKSARKIIINNLFLNQKSKSIKKLLQNSKPTDFYNKEDFKKLIANFNATAEMHITCDKCLQCLKNEKHVCQKTKIKGVHENGAFAEFIVVPVSNILLYHKNDLPLDIIAFMDALGNATHTVFSAEIKNANVLILGCGVQGIMATAIAKYAGAKNIFVTDISSANFSHENLVNKRFKLAKTFGATECFDFAIKSDLEKFSKIIKSKTNSTGVDVALDMSGSYNAYQTAFESLRMGGTLSLLGIPSGAMQVNFAKEIIFKGITIKGIIGRKFFETWNQMEKILMKGLAKKIITSGFITHQFPLSDFEKAFEAIAKGEAIKILLKP
ncbi:MAG: zinc-binding dehydrogenase [Bacteroidetes bacterium]|nr:zinc-binding dehydrogenase [Bacteroidota bacterium]